MKTLEIQTTDSEEFIDITPQIKSALDVKQGIALIYTPHTTAAITINENADPTVKSDILMGLDDIVNNLPYQHSEGNSPAHIKSSLIGCHQTVIIQDGQLTLGTWQAIYFCEFDGPRTRKIYVQEVGKP